MNWIAKILHFELVVVAVPLGAVATKVMPAVITPVELAYAFAVKAVSVYYPVSFNHFLLLV